jgi:hypothetical protein
MVHKKIFSIFVLVLLISACTMPGWHAVVSGLNQDPTAVSQTQVAESVASIEAAQTALANAVASTLAAMATNTPEFTFTPSLTPTPTFTLTPAFPLVSVSIQTNCRTGPGKVYDVLGIVNVGQVAEVVGRSASSDNWIIKLPSNPAITCWLWGFYATVVGNTSGLPVIIPPPTPTPASAFTFSYEFWGVGPGYQCFKFEVNNTGAVTWESFTITLHNGAHGTTATDSSNEFIGYDNWCLSTGSQSDLMPGETGTASVKTFLAYNPVGESFDVTLRLCSENGLAGTCLSKTINFNP